VSKLDEIVSRLESIEGTAREIGSARAQELKKINDISGEEYNKIASNIKDKFSMLVDRRKDKRIYFANDQVERELALAEFEVMEVIKKPVLEHELPSILSSIKEYGDKEVSILLYEIKKLKMARQGLSAGARWRRSCGRPQCWSVTGTQYRRGPLEGAGAASGRQSSAGLGSCNCSSRSRAHCRRSPTLTISNMAASAAGRISGDKGAYPHAVSMSAISPLRSSTGCGGQPGMCRSTGITADTGPAQA
jgi:hypothetical protein